MPPRKTPRYVMIDGIRVDECFLPENVHSATQYKPRPDDVIVATYPKCGTTWMCQIVLLLLRKGRLPPSNEEYFKSIPFLELQGAQAAETMSRPGCIKTHLPFDRITFSKKAKYIYVARHPRDCVVSFYHHTKLFPTYFFSDGTFDDFFEIFIRGEVDFNDYFDNLLSWYENRNEPNIFFTTFERMKDDHRGTVLDVAKFLGEECHASLKENGASVLNQVLLQSSFEYMNKNTNEMFKQFFLTPLGGDDPASKRNDECLRRAEAEGHKSVGEFVRAGRVGEGKIVLSEDQEDKLARRILEKTQGSDVMSLWDK